MQTEIYNEKIEKYGKELEGLVLRAAEEHLYILPYVQKRNGKAKAGFALYDSEKDEECCLQMYDEENYITN